MSLSRFTMTTRRGADEAPAASQVVHFLPADVPREPVTVTVVPFGGDPRSFLLDLTKTEGAIVNPHEGLVLSLIRENREGRVESLTFATLADARADEYEARRAARLARRAARAKAAK